MSIAPRNHGSHSNMVVRPQGQAWDPYGGNDQDQTQPNITTGSSSEDLPPTLHFRYGQKYSLHGQHTHNSAYTGCAVRRRNSKENALDGESLTQQTMSPNSNQNQRQNSPSSYPGPKGSFKETEFMPESKIPTPGARLDSRFPSVNQQCHQLQYPLSPNRPYLREKFVKVLNKRRNLKATMDGDSVVLITCESQDDLPFDEVGFSAILQREMRQFVAAREPHLRQCANIEFGPQYTVREPPAEFVGTICLHQ
jgi:hypothetical protein